MNVMRLIGAFLSAATLAAFLPFIGACAVNLVITGTCDVDFGWIPFALVITLASTLFISVPLFLLFRKLGWVKWWQICLGGGLVGLLAAVLIQISDSGSNWIWHQLATFSIPLGALSALAFWWIGVRTKLVGDT